MIYWKESFDTNRLFFLKRLVKKKEKLCYVYILVVKVASIGRFVAPLPNHQQRYAKWNLRWNVYLHIAYTFFAHLAPICMLINNFFFASELSQKFIKGALLVGYDVVDKGLCLSLLDFSGDKCKYCIIIFNPHLLLCTTTTHTHTDINIKSSTG